MSAALSVYDNNLPNDDVIINIQPIEDHEDTEYQHLKTEDAKNESLSQFVTDSDSEPLYTRNKVFNLDISAETSVTDPSPAIPESEKDANTESVYRATKTEEDKDRKSQFMIDKELHPDVRDNILSLNIPGLAEGSVTDSKPEVPGDEHTDNISDMNDIDNPESYQEESNGELTEDNNLHNEGIYVCKNCGYKCSTLHNLTVHQYKHRAKKSFKYSSNLCVSESSSTKLYQYNTAEKESGL